MIRTLCLILGCLLCLAGVAAAKDAPPPENAPLKGLRFSTPAEASAVIEVLEALDHKAVPHTHPDEALVYRIKAGPLGLLSGKLSRSVQLVELHGRPAYRIQEAVHIWNLHQEAEALLDATALLPLRFTRTNRRGRRKAVVHEIIWDHINGNVYGEVTRGGKVSSRHNWVLKRDISAAALDPLSALLVYRLRCSAAGKALAWQVPVLDGCINRFTCKITPQGATYRPQPNVADVAEAIRVDWHMKPLSGDEGERRATLALGTTAPAVLLSGSGKRWGLEFKFTLEENSQKTGKR